MPCDVCSNLQPKTLSEVTPGQRAILFAGLKDLIYSADVNSCPLCGLLLAALRTKKHQLTKEDDASSVELRIAIGKPLQLYYRHDGIYLEIYTVSDDQPGLPSTIGRGTVVSKRSDSPDCLKLVKDWFETCRASHKRCQTRAPTPLPTRVLRIDGANIEPHVCVWETHGTAGSYAALSYCWGDAKNHNVLKTTKMNIEVHKNRITLQSLPKTLRDAVEIARHLKFQYLWVDALCIIQDDPDDWAFEAAQMCEVYSNASITIVASAADGSSVGIFRDQDYSQADEIQFGVGASVFVRSDLSRDHGELDILEREPWNNEPINKRAWTLQEAVLSNRALFFTSTEVRWLCNERRECECGTLSAPLEVSDLGNSSSMRLAELFGQQTLSEAFTKWNDVVMSFSKRNLTYGQDRLPALSGLAKKFAELLKHCCQHEDRYLAGVWESQLYRALLWKVDDYSDVENTSADLLVGRQSQWRAPSWSWAALNAPIVYPPYIGLQSRLKILGAEASLSTSNTYGKVKAAHLRIRAPMLHGLTAQLIDTGQKLYGDWRSTGTLNIDDMASRNAKYLLRIGDTSLGRFCFDYDADHLRPSYSISALVVGYQQILDKYHLLLVQRVHGGAWERVGIASYAPIPPHTQNEFKDMLEGARCEDIMFI